MKLVKEHIDEDIKHLPGKKLNPEEQEKYEDSQYIQVCVWPGVELGDNASEEFEKFILKEFKTRVKFLKVLYTKPDMENGHPIPNTGGRSDLFFKVHKDDIMSFAIPRIQTGIKWIEDFIDNGGQKIHKEDLKKLVKEHIDEDIKHLPGRNLSSEEIEKYEKETYCEDCGEELEDGRCDYCEVEGICDDCGGNIIDGYCVYCENDQSIF